MLITKLTRSYGIFERREANFLTLEPARAFNRLLFKRAHIVQDNGNGSFSIVDDDVVVKPKWGRWVRQWPDEMQKDPAIILDEDEFPMDAYNVALRKYHDNLGMGVYYSNIHIDLIMQHM